MNNPALCQQPCIHPDIVAAAAPTKLLQNKAEKLAEIFKVLGDPTRVKMLHILTAHEMCVCDIAAILNMGQSAISYQLRILRTARLVKYRKEGKVVWYSLDDMHVISLFQQGLEHIEHI